MNRKTLVASVSVVAVTAAFAAMPALTTPPPLPSAVVQIMSYNIKHGECPATGLNLDAVVDVIADVDPQVACLQEVDQNASRSDYVDQSAYIAANTNLSHVVYAPTGPYAEIIASPYVDRYPDIPELYEDTIGEDGYRGIALLSRHPILSSTVHHFEGDVHGRAIIIARLNTPTGVVAVACTHLSTDSAYRTEMVDYLVDNAPATTPSFIAGDFNSRPNSSEITALETEWFNPTSGSPIDTFSRLNPNRQIDYVMSRNVTALSTDAYVITDFQPSDHMPIVGVWNLP